MTAILEPCACSHLGVDHHFSGYPTSVNKGEDGRGKCAVKGCGCPKYRRTA